MHFMDSGNQSLNYVNEEEKHTNKQISFINFHNEEMRSKVFFFLLVQFKINLDDFGYSLFLFKEI